MDHRGNDLSDLSACCLVCSLKSELYPVNRSLSSWSFDDQSPQTDSSWPGKELILSTRKSFRHLHARGHKCAEMELCGRNLARIRRSSFHWRYGPVSLLYYDSPPCVKNRIAIPLASLYSFIYTGSLCSNSRLCVQEGYGLETRGETWP